VKLEPGRNAYPIAQAGHLTCLMLDVGGRGRSADCFVLMPVSPGAMDTLINGASGQMCGFPRYGASLGDQIIVWPAPDGAYDLIATIQPPAVTL
jgi:hypothetical protein